MVDVHPTDVDLVLAVARGDQEALGRLYDRYAPILTALGHRIVGSRKETEDILHDVFIEVFQRAGTYDRRRGTVKTWLLLRMRSRCLDRVKSAGWSRASSLDEREERQQQGYVPRLEGAGDASRLRTALQALPERQRDVLLLGYFEGLSSSEIAKRLNVPIGTVKSRTASALAKLRAAMGVLTEEMS